MSVRAKHVFIVAFGLMSLFVFYVYETPFLDSRSPVWQRIEPAKWWLLSHAVAGSLAFLVAPFQFSAKLRRRHPRLHRVMGRLYVAGVVVATPTAVPVAVILGPPSLVMATVIQSAGWLVTTGIALYWVRRGDIRQHQEWMLRSYPFAMVFILARATLTIPAIKEMGEAGFVSVVWSYVAVAGSLPSLIISLRAMYRRREVKPARTAVTAKAARAAV